MKIEITSPKESGFSFVELSIVMAIIALLTAGIMVGQAIIQSSKLRIIIVEMQTYEKAVLNFQEKYSGLPGDITNATSIFASYPGIAANGNGNSNGQIADVSSTGTALEILMVWQQLAYAGFIQGFYTGKNNGYKIGSDLPRSGYGLNTGYLIVYPTVYYSEPRSNVIIFGTVVPGASGSDKVTANAALLPSEAFNIDTKLDDGLPTTGKIIGATGYNITGFSTTDTLCGNGSGSARVYNLASNIVYCFIRYRILTS